MAEKWNETAQWNKTAEEAALAYHHWRELDSSSSPDEESFNAGYRAAIFRQTINVGVRYSYPGSDKAWFQFSGTGKDLLDVLALSISAHFPIHWLVANWTDWKDGGLVERRISIAEPPK
jgi:hypothetical protein